MSKDLLVQFTQDWHRLSGGIGQRVLLAVSGGLDSMVMASLFHEAGFPFAVAHCNFRLRGAAADEDESFVKAWCGAHGVTCYSRQFDTANIIATEGGSVQNTARRLRYEWFASLLRTESLALICTAHHADDNAETMLINLSRGTGIAGLHGIPERNGNICRPILSATRTALAAWAAAKQISYREDASNATDDYLRNAIRHRVLPELDTLMPGAASRMLDTSRRIGEAEQLYQQGIARERKRLLQQRGPDHYIPLKLLRPAKPLATIIYELLLPFGFDQGQLPDVLHLMDAPAGKYLQSATHRLIRNRDFFVITGLAPSATDLVLLNNFPADVQTASGSFHFNVLEAMPQQLDQGAAIALINAAKLEAPVLLRRWKTGDYFYPLGLRMKKKKIGRFLSDLKMPLQERERVWVLESNKRIVWVAGLRLDERFRVDAGTHRILSVRRVQ